MSSQEIECGMPPRDKNAQRQQRVLCHLAERTDGPAGGRPHRACPLPPRAHPHRATLDLRRAPNAREDCEAACYDCLLSYTDQLAKKNSA
jgi:hypothetical protein